MDTPIPESGTGTDHLARLFRDVRSNTEALGVGLSDADATVQSMTDASPAKWHLGHTSWFFETVVLAQYVDAYEPVDPRYNFVFNSYYEALGERLARASRGMLTRPGLDEVFSYRHKITDRVSALLATDLPHDARELVTLGIHHEQQHQELLLTDILNLFAQNPFRPAYRAAGAATNGESRPPALEWVAFDGSLTPIGHDGPGFAFDCERPRHDALIEPFRLASRPVTNAEWMEFMTDGGYRQPLLWLSDGWAKASCEGWAAPLYWELRNDAWWSMTLGGMQPVDPSAPACHVSYFEADAFARWAGQRLPTEFEWERAAADVSVGDGGAGTVLAPRPADARGSARLRQMFGQVWQWTASPFNAYPRYRPLPGTVGEYNGKFMSGQYVLRGSSCATPAGHARRTYRNFFQPDKRWQFTGVRLAGDA